jgi:hypothetical protein
MSSINRDSSDLAELARELERLESAVADVLKTTGLYDIGSYGWRNENEPDPEFVGHAMWQVDQPLGQALMDTLEERPVRDRPSARDKHVLVAGEDFCGMMRLARLSMGLALLWRAHRPGHVLAEQPYLSLQYTDAVLKLAIAADRLRDVLVVACTGDTVLAYELREKRHKWYVTPFQQIRQLLETRGPVNKSADEAISALPPLADQIYAHLERRNQIVHEIATHSGRLTGRQVEALESRYQRQQQRKTSEPPRMADVRDLQDAQSEYHAELDALVKNVTEWYALLVKTASYVFEIEYWSRVKA